MEEDGAQFALMVALCASVICVGLWLSVLVSQAVYRLGWKKVEYIYTEREKSFVGITIVFVILSLCGHLYRAVHGRRGSWMQLQLPFLTLTNSCAQTGRHRPTRHPPPLASYSMPTCRTAAVRVCLQTWLCSLTPSGPPTARLLRLRTAWETGQAVGRVVMQTSAGGGRACWMTTMRTDVRLREASEWG